MKRFPLYLLDLLHLTPILVFASNIFLNQVLHWYWYLTFFSLIYLDSANLFVNGFFFFLNGSWWDFRLIFLFLFSVWCDSNNKFSAVFIEPFNIALISSTFSLTVCHTFASSSTRNVRFCTSFNSSLQIGPIDLEIFPFFGVFSNTSLILKGSSMSLSLAVSWLSLSSIASSSGP